MKESKEKKMSINEMMEGIENAEVDYIVRRKTIYKGNKVPKGYIFLVIYGKDNGRKFEAKKMIKANQSPEVEKAVCQYMREQIREFNSKNK